MTVPIVYRLIAAWLLLWPFAASAACIDVRSDAPLSLEGTLQYRVFPGPPNYVDIGKGDAPEPAWLLDLDTPTCAEGDAMASPGHNFGVVHLAPDDALVPALQRLTGRPVRVTITTRFPAHTLHHRAPLVATAIAVSSNAPVPFPPAAAPPLARAPAPAAEARGDGFESEPVAAAVRGFYQALGAGDGVAAAEFIVPEKRRGPFSPDRMTAFYGNLDEPLELGAVTPGDRGTWRVSYRFRSGASVCRGEAIVSTELRNARAYIRSIQALNGC